MQFVQVNDRTPYRAFADRRSHSHVWLWAWLSDNEFVADDNMACVKSAVIEDKQHYVCSENTP